MSSAYPVFGYNVREYLYNVREYYAMGFYFKCFGWLESYIDLTGLKYYGEIIEYVRNIKET